MYRIGTTPVWRSMERRNQYGEAMERLNKFLAAAGVGSRRYCDELIAAGRVKVDGQVVTALGTKVDPQRQQVAVDDHPVRPERKVYWLVHKPAGYLCTNYDPAGRPRAVDLLPHVEQRVYTVGRLDEASEGLLLMTNDGELAATLMHPRYGIPKTYLVQVAGKPSREQLQQLVRGIWLSDGKVRARSVKVVRHQGASTWLRIVLCEGKNREIRRMLARCQHKVMRLKRIAIGPVKLGKLGKGKSRRLSPSELRALQEWAEQARTRLAQIRARLAARLKRPAADAADAADVTDAPKVAHVGPQSSPSSSE